MFSVGYLGMQLNFLDYGC